MSIFSRIRDAIFHRTPDAKPVPRGASRTSTSQSSGTSAAGSKSGGVTTASQDAAAQPRPVNVEAVLEERAAKNAQKLNWRTSIVDLMKLLELDPSLENRKQLAAELGYTGDTSDSASMNIWLHKQVMRKLAESGGTVPESLKQ